MTITGKLLAITIAAIPLLSSFYVDNEKIQIGLLLIAALFMVVAGILIARPKNDTEINIEDHLINKPQ